MSWSRRRSFFESRADRPMPGDVEPPSLTETERRALLRSLIIFHQGETGEGRIAHEIEHLHCADIDDDYRAALRLIVAEEGRHARILGLCVRALGGRPRYRTWASRGFTWARRALGVRFKLLVLFAAEVIGIVFYAAIADALPAGDLRHRLGEIARDELAHYEFHLQFFRRYGAHPAKRWTFLLAWSLAGLLCTTILIVDHRNTCRAFGIARADLARRCRRLFVDAARATRRITGGALQRGLGLGA